MEIEKFKHYRCRNGSKSPCIKKENYFSTCVIRLIDDINYLNYQNRKFKEVGIYIFANGNFQSSSGSESEWDMLEEITEEEYWKDQEIEEIYDQLTGKLRYSPPNN